MNYRSQDAEFCGKVPLHQTNLTQPHGVLIVLSHDDLRILQISENASVLFNRSADSLVNTSFSDYLPEPQSQKLRQRFQNESSEGLPFALSINDAELLSLLHVREKDVLIEIEIPRPDRESRTFIQMYQELKCVMSDVDAAATTVDACNRAIQELKRITGFDKIMIYQFDENWNGTVIAEVAEEGMEKYLGLRFPASDVPKQARDLYLKNPYRLIPNVEYSPVKLYPLLNPSTNSFTDLSNTNLRSIAGVHIEYLKNMKVMASMSTRIIQDNRLWGLISCHHRTPKYVSYEMCFVFELVSNIMSAKIASVQKSDSASYNAGLLQPYQRLLENIFLSADIGTVFKNDSGDLLDLLKADGAAFVHNKQTLLFGKTPPREKVNDLIFWLRSQDMRTLYHTAHLSDDFAEAEEFAAEASGLLALPLEPDRGTYLLAFRREFLESVNWGGNPNEAISFEPDRKNYHPRNSFKLWQETVQSASQPWQREELEIAERFRNVLIEFILNKKS